MLRGVAWRGVAWRGVAGVAWLASPAEGTGGGEPRGTVPGGGVIGSA